jgi:hypothetical protein
VTGYWNASMSMGHEEGEKQQLQFGNSEVEIDKPNWAERSIL